jgi:hypothetical protein
VYLDNQPWPGQELRLDAGRSEGFFGVTAKTSDSGGYRFVKVRLGQVRLTLFAPVNREEGTRDHRVQTKSVDVSGDQTTKADFRFTSGTASVEGVLTLNGAPVSHPDAGVSLQVMLPDGMEQYDARPEAGGTYRFPCIVEGDARLTVWTRLLDTPPPPIEITIAAGQAVRRDIELNAPGTE